MVEIKGFDRAYKIARAIQAVEKRQRDAYHKRVKELIDEGVDPVIAKAIAKALKEVNNVLF